MNIVLMIEKDLFKYTEDYVYSIKPLLNCEIILYSHFNNKMIDKQKKYIFWVRIPSELKITNETNNIYIFNTEQMSKKNNSENMNNIHKQIKIIDYSNENLKYLDKTYSSFFLPYQVNYSEIYNFDKDKDICIISDNNISKRRKYIVEKLKQHNINVDIISGFGKQRDLKLFKYKIILNIGWDENYKIFESVRCDRCVLNKMVIISDYKHNQETYHLKDFIIFEDYEKIPNRVKHTLDNYNNIHQNLFETFNLEKIDKLIKEMSVSTINEILN